MKPFDGKEKKPINKLAALVFSKGTKVNEREIPETIKCSQIQPETKKVPYLTKQSGDDLTGVKQGKLTVIGLDKIKKGIWVVRCYCGNYAHRSAKAIKNKENRGDRCEYCRRKSQSIRKHNYHINGRETDVRDV